MKSRTLFKLAACGALCLCAALSHASVLYSNGEAVGSAGKSVLAPQAVSLGFGAQNGSRNSVADDFTIGGSASWLVSSIDFFAYQNSATSFTLLDVIWTIVSGDLNGGTVVASGTTHLGNGGLVGYRVTSASSTDTTKQIFEATADIADVLLGPGHYWLTWSMTGSRTSGPWQPPTADGATGNAMQSLAGGAYSSLIDGGSGKSVELPFVLNGNVVPEPSSLALALVGGLALVGVRRARRG